MRAEFDDAEILSRLTRIQRMVVPATAPVTGLLTAVADEDDEELDFDKGTFAANDFILVGAGLLQHLNQIVSIPADTAAIPVMIPSPVDYEIGTRVAKCVVQNLGYIEEGSASLGGSASVASVGAANAGGRIWYGAPEVGDLTISWGQRASSIENILSAYGIDEAQLKGDGTSGNPYRGWIHPSVMGSHRDFAYRLTGLLNDGRSQYMDILNPTPQIQISTSYGAKNQPAVWTVGCVFTHKHVHLSV